MGSDSDPSPPFRAFPWFRSVTAARRATRKLAALRAGASSGRTAVGHRRRRRRVRARWPTPSSRAWRRSDGPQQGAVWCAPDPRSRRVLPQLTRGRREPVPPRVLRGAVSPCARAGGLLPVRLLAAAADLAADGVRTLPGPRLREAYSYAPRSAILLSAMADGARRENSAVYVGAFCRSGEAGCQAPFQRPAEDGYRADW